MVSATLAIRFGTKTKGASRISVLSTKKREGHHLSRNVSQILLCQGALFLLTCERYIKHLEPPMMYYVVAYGVMILVQVV